MGLSSHRRVHLDSSVYIAFLKGETIPAHGGMNRVDLAQLILDAGEAGLITVFTRRLRWWRCAEGLIHYQFQSNHESD